MHAIDVANVTNPVEVATFETTPGGNTIWGMAVKRDTVFIASAWSGIWVLKNDLATSVRENSSDQPTQYTLLQNYPNPFNPSTTIIYEIPNRTYVTLEIYDVLGRKIATLVDGIQEAGRYKAIWDVRTMSSGVYFYRLTAGQQIFAKKMVIIR